MKFFNKTKGYITILLSILMVSSIMVLPTTAVFEIIGSVLPTDIKAYINGAEIPSYNVNGNLVVFASDLKNYGFYVEYDNKTRQTSVEYHEDSTYEFMGYTKIWNPIEVSEIDNESMMNMNVYDTDILVYIQYHLVDAYNIDGKMAVKFSDLKGCGRYEYNNDTRSSNLYLDEDNYVSPIQVLDIIPTINTVGGVNLSVWWRNDSPKTIKYIYFYVIPYNAVDDPVYCTVTLESEKILKGTGPYTTFDIHNFAINNKTNCYYDDARRMDLVHTDDYYGTGKLLRTCYHYGEFGIYEVYENDKRHVFDNADEFGVVWYNSTVSRVYLSKLDVEYMDGTSETIYIGKNFNTIKNK